MRHRFTALLAATLGVASPGALAQAPSGDAARGQSLFMKDMCYTCHGTVGHGTPYGLRLAPNPIPWEGFAHQIRQPRGSMPRYPAQFVSEQDLADIYAYIASIRPGPKASDISLLKD
jgi:ubiquinol-cytochrome c reductase cytochrome c subunit